MISYDDLLSFDISSELPPFVDASEIHYQEHSGPDFIMEKKPKKLSLTKTLKPPKDQKLCHCGLALKMYLGKWVHVNGQEQCVPGPAPDPKAVPVQVEQLVEGHWPSPAIVQSILGHPVAPEVIDDVRKLVAAGLAGSATERAALSARCESSTQYVRTIAKTLREPAETVLEFLPMYSHCTNPKCNCSDAKKGRAAEAFRQFVAWEPPA